ncbi:unnamed protein product [Ambrosiozyma monospora]|uniref:Unnamed protein product n=1 Tax=Ambrosiozyma monospora TaxID=43982 RepID=A0ACB5U8N3_AMBMO|nr:unnamed protein product [Ambrosiozyma monospora]
MMQRKTFELRRLNKKHGIKQSRTLLSPVTQITYSLGSFFGIREMCNLPVESLKDGGALWFYDLTATDPYLGLQLMSACVYSLSMHLGGDTAMNQFSGRTKKFFVALPFLSVIFTYQLSAGVLVYFAANGFFSVFQGRLLRSPAFRKWYGLYPLPDPATVKKNGSAFDNIAQTWKELKEDSASGKLDADQKARQATELALAKAKSGRVVIDKKMRR